MTEETPAFERLRDAYVELLRRDFPWVPTGQLETLALESMEMDIATWNWPPTREILGVQAEQMSRSIPPPPHPR